MKKRMKKLSRDGRGAMRGGKRSAISVEHPSIFFTNPNSYGHGSVSCRTSRIFSASSSVVKGFWRKAAWESIESP
jgi:hypothetical protein